MAGLCRFLLVATEPARTDDSLNIVGMAANPDLNGSLKPATEDSVAQPDP